MGTSAASSTAVFEMDGSSTVYIAAADSPTDAKIFGETDASVICETMVWSCKRRAGFDASGEDMRTTVLEVTSVASLEGSFPPWSD